MPVKTRVDAADRLDAPFGEGLSMSWEKKFGEPIRLKTGRELKTLPDARAQILRMEGWVRGSRWEYAIELLLKAAETGRKADVQDAWAQVARALFAEGLIARS